MTIENSRATGKYGDADGYDSYMGRWSAALAPLFVQFASVGHPSSLLDIGSGTGNLLVAAAAAFPNARLVGIDPSTSLLKKARARPELRHVELIESTADELPFPDGVFDGCLSLLVLQEFADRLGPLREMRRVTRASGVVAACQWDFSRMPVIAALVDAISAIDADAGVRLATRSPRLFADEAELSEAWTEAGFDEVSAGRIELVHEFGDFDELWRPLLAGSTPSTLTLASLPPAEQGEVRRRMCEQLGRGDRGGPLALRAEAIAVRGRV